MVFGAPILVAVTEKDAYVSPRHICEAIGISWPSQYTKITKSKMLGEGVVVITTPSTGGDRYLSPWRRWPRHVCDGVGVGWNNQHKKILSSEDLSSCMAKVSIMVPGDTQARKFLMLPLDKLLSANRFDIKLVSEDGMNRSHIMLPLDKMAGWLFVTNPIRVRKISNRLLHEYTCPIFIVKLRGW